MMLSSQAFLFLFFLVRHVYGEGEKCAFWGANSSSSSSSSLSFLGLNTTNSSATQGTRLLFLRRMRKCGSTTLQNFFARATRVSWRSTGEKFNLQANEFMVLNSACLRDSSLFGRVLFITHLREPISRLHSEFHNVGPGSVVNGRHSIADVSAWEEWMRFSEHLMDEGRFESLIRGGLYMNNLFARAMSGNCSATCLTENSYTKRETRAVKHLPGCRLCRKKQCGDGVKGFRRELSTDDLAVAMENLERFDLVITLEHLSSPVFQRWLVIEFLQLPESEGMFIGHARNSEGSVGTKLMQSSIIPERAPQTAVPRAVAPSSVLRRLKAENWLDVRIYTEWKGRVDCAMKRLEASGEVKRHGHLLIRR